MPIPPSPSWSRTFPDMRRAWGASAVMGMAVAGAAFTAWAKVPELARRLTAEYPLPDDLRDALARISGPVRTRLSQVGLVGACTPFSIA